MLPPQVPVPPGLRRLLWAATAGRRRLLHDGHHGGDRHGETHRPAPTGAVDDGRHQGPAARHDPPARHRAAGQGPRRGHRGDDAEAAAPTGPAPDGAPCPPTPPDDAADKTRKRPEHEADAKIFSPFLWTAKATSLKTLKLKRPTRRPGAQIAQLVEQRIENPRVGGSIPSLGTNTFNRVREFCR